MEQTFKSSINVKTLGNPKWLLGRYEMKEGDKRLLGTILGQATGKVKRANPTQPDITAPDAYFYGLAGKFEAVNTDDNGEITRTVTGKNLFAPEVIHDNICEKLDKFGKGAIVKFAFQAFVVAGGSAGFTWEYRFLGPDGEPDENDPLADVRLLLTGSGASLKRLADHSKKSKDKV